VRLSHCDENESADGGPNQADRRGQDQQRDADGDRVRPADQGHHIRPDHLSNRRLNRIHVLHVDLEVLIVL